VGQCDLIGHLLIGQVEDEQLVRRRQADVEDVAAPGSENVG
jgi:hypothetical protein